MTPETTSATEHPFKWSCPRCGHAQRDSVHPVEGPYLTLICGRCESVFHDADLAPADLAAWEAARVAAEGAA